MLIENAELFPGRDRGALRVRDGRIHQVAAALDARPGERVIDARGGALLPGLHDHHIHLLALAAARRSVACGPPEVTTAQGLARALGGQPGTGWLRGVGYHESVAGLLDRRQLDALAPGRPVRIQHASGKMWFVNSAAAEALGLSAHPDLAGIERDAAGEPTGRLFRLDEWVRSRLGEGGAPDLGPVSTELASCGVSGVTDATPGNDAAAVALFAAAMERGELRQRLRLMGADDLPLERPNARLVTGELKILLDEYALPDVEALIGRVRRSHRAGRGAAFHCVTRTELVFALHVLEQAGAGRDRIEHASVAPDDLVPLLLATGVTVVTQPGLIAERGDRYLAEVPPSEVPHLYRMAGLLRRGVPVAASSDAPYGPADPWRAMRAAVSRRSRAGVVIGANERVTPEAALAGFLSAPDAPGGPPRRLAPGAAADLCLLDRPWGDARETLDRAHVTLTLRDGEVIFERRS